MKYHNSIATLILLFIIPLLILSVPVVTATEDITPEIINTNTFVEQGTTPDIPTNHIRESISSLLPSQHELLQTSPTFDLNNYQNLKGTNLHFSGWIDYNNDSTNDMIFVVEFNGTDIPYDLIIFNGIDYQILITYKNIGDNDFTFTYNTYFVPNQIETLSDLLLRFKSEISNLCRWVFVGITSKNTEIVEEDCLDYQYVTDWDGNGDLEIVRFSDAGNFWINEVNENLDEGDTGNLLAFTGIEGSFTNFEIGNFTGDNIPDFSLIQSSPDKSSAQLYIVDGLTSTLISNTSLDGGINTVLPLNIDNIGIDELIYISSITGEVSAKNITGFNLPYSIFHSGYAYQVAQVIPDVNDDNVKDILLIIESSSMIVISGIDGQMLALSTHTSAIENSIRTQREISIGQFGDKSYFVLQSNENDLKILTVSEGESIEQLILIPWNPTLLKNDLEISSTEYLIDDKFIHFNIDLDKDGLSAIDEFFLGTNDLLEDSDGDSLLDIDETTLGLNPLSKDSDGDGMPDNYEVENKLNAFIDDSNLDNDRDDMTNLEEYIHESDVNNQDTDGDGLPDGWEWRYGYNFINQNSVYFHDDNDTLDAQQEYDHGTNPLLSDTDGDQIPDDWEVKYDLNPLEFQNQTNFDDDGLSALEEYNNGINPRLRDTDGDGLTDGYEVRNGLDPTKSDAGDDEDKDFLNNRWEERLGTNPNGRFDQFISILVLTILVAGSGLAIVSYRKLSAEAKSGGFSSYLQMRAMKNRGFSSLTDFEEAQKMGFNILEAKVLFNSYGIVNVELMVLQWENLIKKLEAYLQEPLLQNIIETINKTQTIGGYETILETFKGEINQSRSNIQKTEKMISEMDTIVDLTSRSKTSPFTHLETIQITEYRVRLNDKLKIMNDLDGQYSDTIAYKDKWFKPWPALLTIIQMAADKSKLDLEEIRQVLSTDAEHAKQLIKVVLSDNPLIGSYSDESDQFTKGTGIDDYLKFVLDRFGEDES